MVQLFINNELVDLSQKGLGTEVLYTTENGLGEPQGASSYTINLPYTNRNQRVLKASVDAGVTDAPGLGLDVPRFLNRLPARLMVSGVEVLNGWWQLEEIDTSVGYRGVIVGANSSWGLFFKDLKLKDINGRGTWRDARWRYVQDGCTYLDTQANDGSIGRLWQVNLGNDETIQAEFGAVTYPIVDYGNGPQADLPATYVRQLLAAAFEDYGYGLDSKFLLDNKNLALLFTNGSATSSSQRVLHVLEVEQQIVAGLGPPFVGRLRFDSGEYNSVDGDWTAPLTGTTVLPPGTYGRVFRPRRVETTEYRFRLRGFNGTNCNGTPEFSWATLKLVRISPTLTETTLATYVLAPDAEFNIDDVISVTGSAGFSVLLDWRLEWAGMLGSPQAYVSYYNVEALNVPSTEADPYPYPNVNGISTGLDYDVRDLLPDITVGELLADLARAFDLLVYTNETTRVVTIEQRSELWASRLNQPALDVTPNTDTQGQKIRFSWEFVPKSRLYAWAEDSVDEQLAGYRTDVGSEYAAYTLVTDNPNNGEEEDNRLSVLAPSIMELASGVWFPALLSTTGPGEIDFGPRLVRITQRAGSGGIGIGVDAPGGISTGPFGLPLGRCKTYTEEACDSPTPPTYMEAAFTQESPSDAELGLTFGELASATYGQSTGLYPLYHAPYIERLQSGRTLECTALVRGSAFTGLSLFGQPILYKGHLYYLYRMNYSPDSLTAVLYLFLYR